MPPQDPATVTDKTAADTATEDSFTFESLLGRFSALGSLLYTWSNSAAVIDPNNKKAVRMYELVQKWLYPGLTGMSTMTGLFGIKPNERPWLTLLMGGGLMGSLLGVQLAKSTPPSETASVAQEVLSMRAFPSSTMTASATSAPLAPAPVISAPTVSLERAPLASKGGSALMDKSMKVHRHVTSLKTPSDYIPQNQLAQLKRPEDLTSADIHGGEETVVVTE